MKYVKQIGIILGITLAGECLNQFLPLPVPPGVYGLFLLLGTLLTGAMKLESVEGTGNFLMDTMSMMFIPATVGIIECADQLRTVLLPFLLIIAVSTIAVMAVTGKVAQHMVEKKENREDGKMKETLQGFLDQSQYWGLVFSIAAYLFACWLKEKTRLAILNPLLVSAAIIIVFLVGVGEDYTVYNQGASYLSWLLTPATVCLAIPLYKQLHLLKKHGAAVALSITAGVITSAVSIFLMSRILGLTHIDYVTLLPKSITTAIGMGVSEEAGGIVTLTVMSIILTGVIGNVLGEIILHLTGVRHPVAKGLALGTSAHAIGTAKALELGEIEGAMSSLSIAVAGLMTVIAVPFAANLM